VSDHPPASADDSLLGQQVGEYQVLAPVGEGGMGVVYLGIQPVIKKRVAIKVLKPQVAADEHQVRRLVAEAESVNSIGHRGIIDIFSLGTLPDGRPYIVMEYLDGEALDQWLLKQPGGRVSLPDAMELLLEVCAPLAAAHRAGVIHRDLKPSNIFVCRQADGTRYLKLLDFGLAKRAMGLDGNTKQTNQSVVAGTPDYMAPEQARGLDISPRSDIYALGVIAFELLCGRVPFQGATPMDVMVAHVGAKPPQPRELEPSLPESLEALVLSMLAKAPEERPQTVEAVRSALEDIMQADLGMAPPRTSQTNLRSLGQRPSQPSHPQLSSAAAPAPLPLGPPMSPPAGAPPPAAARRGPSRGLVAAAALAGLGAVGAIAWLTSRPGPVPAEPKNPTTSTPLVDAVDPAPASLDAAVFLAAVAPAVDAGADDEPDEPEQLAPVSSDAGVKLRRPPPPPTTQQLHARIAKLETRAKTKKDLDPTALKYLARYRIEATAADTPARRAKLDKALSDWERNFLKR
jgi:serine/threonine-protein kinase